MSASHELVIASPEGRSNSSDHPFTVADVPLVSVTPTWWPLPQSPWDVKVAVKDPAAAAGWAATRRAATSVVTAARATVTGAGRRRPIPSPVTLSVRGIDVIVRAPV